jgi:hypothetical protein
VGDGAFAAAGVAGRRTGVESRPLDHGRAKRPEVTSEAVVIKRLSTPESLCRPEARVTEKALDARKIRTRERPDTGEPGGRRISPCRVARTRERRRRGRDRSDEDADRRGDDGF